MLAAFDFWIVSFSALTVIATIWMGFWAARRSKTASDFFVAGRGVSVGWNASAISGEYLSAASFMGIAGMVMSSGYDALWYPVCYACGYLFLLLFIAGPLRRFGAYTIPDFAEGRYDSPTFRKLAVIFVLFIGFFYTMPQMKGAGTTLAYIFPGLPYSVGVVLVGMVITLNVALGGMKGITLVQAFQYWLKMFAISVPVFVLMAVYGHYGKQLGLQQGHAPEAVIKEPGREPPESPPLESGSLASDFSAPAPAESLAWTTNPLSVPSLTLDSRDRDRGEAAALFTASVTPIEALNLAVRPQPVSSSNLALLAAAGSHSLHLKVAQAEIELPGSAADYLFDRQWELLAGRLPAWPGQLTRIAAASSPAGNSGNARSALTQTQGGAPASPREEFLQIAPPGFAANPAIESTHLALELPFQGEGFGMTTFAPLPLTNVLRSFGERFSQVEVLVSDQLAARTVPAFTIEAQTPEGAVRSFREMLETNGIAIRYTAPGTAWVLPLEQVPELQARLAMSGAAESAPAKPGPADPTWLSPFGPLTTKAPRAANLSAAESKPYALLYTYSLIIALVCGTAGLPHILVRFYTNPDGVAAKRTTMWVMILIGTFYVFPPVFGVMGRNLLPELYAGSGAKGTDKVVLELPRVLDRAEPLNPAAVAPEGEVETFVNASSARFPWGSVLSGITCAGAFAAFMSTFSGLLVSMTGALAHDIYGRILRPGSTASERMRMFKVFAWVIGGIATLLGCFVEPLQINFMVGQAFAIAAASYFPLLFMSVWWRGMTMRGAAIGMLSGGISAVVAVSVTNFSDLGWLPLQAFWAAHPLLRILCEQPAIWAVPGAIGLMVLVSRLTRPEVPSDIRMKMLVLHAPENLGLKQEYIREHESH